MSQRKLREPRRPNLDLSGRVPAHQLGQVLISGSPVQLLDFGAWDATVAYQPGNVVNDSGVSYLCIAANTNDEPPDPSSWQVFDPTAYFLRQDRVWSPGGIKEITSDDQSIIVTNPTGPIADLAVNQQWGWAYDSSVTVPAGGAVNEVTVDWTAGANSGTMWDFSTPTAPKWLHDGIIVVSVIVDQADGDTPMGAGTQLEYALGTPFPTASFPQLLALNGKGFLAADGTQQRLFGCGVTFRFGGDAIGLRIANTDSIDHDVFWWVQAIQIVGN